LIMRHRARAIGGGLAFEPVDPHGLAVECVVPTGGALGIRKRTEGRGQ
jgi:hypothetical protein